MTANSRAIGREFVKKSVPAEIWQKNEIFSSELLEMIKMHPMTRHPLIKEMSGAALGLDVLRAVHLEFRTAFAQVFTDALIQTMFTSAQLEPRQKAMGKVSARFLLALNMLDELGFEAGVVVGGEYAGTPLQGHYVEFEKTLHELGLTDQQIQEYVPSDAAVACRRTMENVYGDHAMLSLVLAAAETVFSNFAGPWAKNVGARTKVDTSQGYHAIHVEHEGDFIDDEHSEDMWFVFRQAIEPKRYDEARAKTREVLDTWNAFLDHLGRAVG